MRKRQADNRRVGRYKVLLVMRWPLGGIRSFVRYVYGKFDPEKYHLSILAPELPELRVMLEDLQPRDVLYIPCEPNPDTWTFFKVVWNEILNHKYDIVHSQGFTAGIGAAIPCRIKWTPHLLTIHDTFNDEQFTGIMGHLKKYAIGVLLGLIDMINPVSYDARDNLLTHLPFLKIFKKKVVVITNGIEIERFINAEGRDFRKELNLAEDIFLIGYLGRFMSPKGFKYLVEAIQILYAKDALPKKPMVLAFGSDDGFIRQEKENVRKKGMEDVIRFMQFAPNVASVLMGLDVVVMPSLWEACPLQPMEAMVAGVPIIGTDCRGLREVLAGTPGIMVHAGDSNALADAIYNEMVNPSRDTFYRFKEKAAKRFDVKAQSDRLDAVISNLIGKRSH